MAVLNFRSNVTTIWDYFLQQQNDDTNSELLGKDNNKVEQLNNSNKEDSVLKNAFIPPQTITVQSDKVI